MTMQSNRPMRFLLVEDSEGDIELTRAAMSEAKVSNEMSVVRDGVFTERGRVRRRGTA